MRSYYWKCCGEQHNALSLADARSALEFHEALQHKKKPFGSFGYEVVRQWTPTVNEMPKASVPWEAV
jgi:hypothetical protein